MIKSKLLQTFHRVGKEPIVKGYLKWLASREVYTSVSLLARYSVWFTAIENGYNQNFTLWDTSVYK